MFRVFTLPFPCALGSDASGIHAHRKVTSRAHVGMVRLDSMQAVFQGTSRIDIRESVRVYPAGMIYLSEMSKCVKFRPHIGEIARVLREHQWDTAADARAESFQSTADWPIRTHVCGDRR